MGSLGKSAITLSIMVRKSVFFNFLKIYIILFKIKKTSLATLQNSIFDAWLKSDRLLEKKVFDMNNHEYRQNRDFPAKKRQKGKRSGPLAIIATQLSKWAYQTVSKTPVTLPLRPDWTWGKSSILIPLRASICRISRALTCTWSGLWSPARTHWDQPRR